MHCFLVQGEDVFPQVTDDQPRNPYTEVTVLSGHMATVHHIEILDHKRFHFIDIILAFLCCVAKTLQTCMITTVITTVNRLLINYS